MQKLKLSHRASNWQNWDNDIKPKSNSEYDTANFCNISSLTIMKTEHFMI